MNIIIYYCIAALIMFSIVSESEGQKSRKIVPAVTICQLEASPYKFDRRKIRLAAIYKSSFEGDYLFGLKCLMAVGVDRDCDTATLCKELDDKLNEKMDEDNIVDGKFIQVTAIGQIQVTRYTGSRAPAILFRLKSIERTSKLTTKQWAFVTNRPTKPRN